MVAHRVRFRLRIALSLDRADVQQPGAFQAFQVFQDLDQAARIVPVGRAVIADSEFLEQRTRRGHHALDVFGDAAHELVRKRDGLQQFFTALADGGRHLSGEQPGQVIGHGADIGRNRHLVVIEDDQQVGIAVAQVIQGFIRHPARDAAVSDDCDDLAFLALRGTGNGHPQGRADRRARMAGPEMVVFAFAAFRERCQSVLGPDGRDAVLAAREDLVRVALMADVPHDPVMRGIEDIVQGHGDLDGTEAATEVPAAAGNGIQQEVPQLVRDGRHLVFLQGAQVRGAVDLG